jgi:hypothetical protein
MNQTRYSYEHSGKKPCVHPGNLEIVPDVMEVGSPICRVLHVNGNMHKWNARPYGTNQYLRIESHSVRESAPIEESDDDLQWVHPQAA